jgi:hypothetical protein
MLLRLRVRRLGGRGGVGVGMSVGVGVGVGGGRRDTRGGHHGFAIEIVELSFVRVNEDFVG